MAKQSNTETAPKTPTFQTVANVVAGLNKHYGKTLVKSGKDIPEIRKVPFGEPALDYVTDGGIPICRVTEFLGDAHCLHSDTFIHYQTRTKDGKKQNDKGGSIKTLYNKFHKKDIINKRRLKTVDSEYFIQSISSDETVFMNKIVDVFFNGIRDCYEVKTDAGKVLISTDEHKYYVGGGEFKKLKDLTAGDTIYSYDRKPVRKDFTNRKLYKEVFIKGYHPKLGIKKVGIYEYYRGLEHRLVYEAFLNGYTYEQYLNILNDWDIEFINGLKFIPEGYQIHHIDDDTQNNSLDNLQMVTLKEHNEIHSKIDSLKKTIYKDEITSIRYIGKADVYDIECAEPYHNYIAQGIVVHNSGKTRNSLKSMANFQRYCFNCFTPKSLKAEWRYDKNGNPELVSCKCSNCDNPKTNVQVIVDTEGTIDPKFLDNFGIIKEGVIYTRPDKPSQAVGIVDTFLRMPEIGLILFDSVGSMGSDKEVDTAIEDDKMNQNALFMNKAIRKWQMALNSNTNETGLENGTTLIVVNQSYQTLSIYSTEVAQGGRGLRHGKGLSVKTRIKEKTKDSNDEITGVHVKYVNEKNKTGVPYRSSEYYLNLDKTSVQYGYCQTNVKFQYVEYGIKFGLIKQMGAWYEYNGNKFQGKNNLINSVDDTLMDAVNAIIHGK